MKRKIQTLTPEARERLRAVERVLAGETRRDVARSLNLDESLLGDWVRWYEEGGIARLSVPRKPRKDNTMDADALRAALAEAPEKYRARLARLLRVAQGEQLRKVAHSEGISEQMIMKDRRAWLRNCLPPKDAA